MSPNRDLRGHAIDWEAFAECEAGSRREVDMAGRSVFGAMGDTRIWNDR